MRVLLAVDGSAHSIRAARFLIKLVSEHGAVALDVLNVQPHVRYGALLKGEARAQAERVQLERGREDSASVCALLEQARLPHELCVVSDDAAEAISRTARERGCDLIVMGTRGMGAVASLALGSVAQRVIHLATVPVTLVK